MDKYINESLNASPQAVTCSICGRSVNFYDRISDDSLTCLSCSYKEGYQLAENCVIHGREFDPQDDGMRLEMIRIAQTDIDRSDKSVCTVPVVLPEDLWEPLSKLMKRSGSTLNSEVVAALGWYTTICTTPRRDAPLDFSKVETVKAESSELTDILADDSRVGSS